MTVDVPDSALAREAAEFVRDTAGPLLYDHSCRVYHFGALQGRRRGLEFDAELLYVAALFHDLGLVAGHRSDRRFELDGADEARRFLLGHGVDAERARIAWTAIALHTTPGIPEYLEPEVALVTAGVEYDVLGIGYHELPAEARAAIVAAHPRPDFKRRILAAFTEGIRDRPDTTFGNVKADVLARFVPGFVRKDFVTTIEESPWED
ncbi:HD domain-containing protein [Amycolatopsis australiensis]|uniref:HD superfamily phosphodieaserase, includes HD domain of RNase Y n=1 Tax=Amycolatopsis australiensis TaxID=546364 RepID=A0A1K1SVZ8_9PSEU|nr:HD domain-containing protein [Amycolatopsis australiensis]SFW88223.1 HD superfamily phosphodieaserase, includes HD domain of RNase Y [Amycolatopsis australiensis]